MKLALLDLLICPLCHDTLTLTTSAEDAGEIMAGALTCAGCGRTYPVFHGVPDFTAPAERNTLTARAFGYQWTMHDRGRFEQETIYGITADEEFRDFCRYLGIAGRADIAGTVLEAGCGVGRLVETAARRMPGMVVVGLDFSDAVFPAHERTRELPNAHVVRASVFEPPFRPGSFDYLWSEGVVVATADPKRAFLSLARLLAPGGALYIWVYPTSFHPTRFLRDVMVRPYRLPKPVLMRLSHLLAVPMYALYATAERLGKTRRHHPFGEVVLTLFDNLSPEYQSRHTPAEIAAWFTAAGLEPPAFWDPPLGASGRRAPVAGVAPPAPVPAGGRGA